MTIGRAVRLKTPFDRKIEIIRANNQSASKAFANEIVNILNFMEG